MSEGGSVVMGTGRLNPFTRGHKALVEKLKEAAQEFKARPILFIIDGEKTSLDKRKNPLTGDQRSQLVRRLYPDLDVDVVSSPFEALEVLDLQGLKPKAWVVGSDRAKGYQRLIISENLDCKMEILDRHSGQAPGISATGARNAALENNMEEFARHMPPELSSDELATIAGMIREVNHGRREQE
jgi:hypothetical protein